MIRWRDLVAEKYKDRPEDLARVEAQILADAEALRLKSLLPVLRANGVRIYENDSIHVELATSEPPGVTPGSVVPEDPPCKCGHPVHQHNDVGLCLAGCEPDKCATAEAKQ